ncbi:MAG: response regulator [Syntrophomonadaceae bacterium]|nr:response regulator [Syntrophomonadaceae bacterium]
MSSILVVDDQIGVRRLLVETFRDQGFSVDLAANGYEALEKLKEKVPDLILLDMKMPGMNGLEVLRQIKQRYPEQAVIMMTAYGELEIVNEAINLGVKECITKPFDINQLRELAQRIISGTYQPGCELTG